MYNSKVAYNVGRQVYHPICRFSGCVPLTNRPLITELDELAYIGYNRFFQVFDHGSVERLRVESPSTGVAFSINFATMERCWELL